LARQFIWWSSSGGRTLTGHAVATGSKIQTRPEVLHVDKVIASAALYELAKNCGPLTGAANHSGTPYGAQSLHDAMPAFFGGHCFFGSLFESRKGVNYVSDRPGGYSQGARAGLHSNRRHTVGFVRSAAIAVSIARSAAPEMARGDRSSRRAKTTT